MSEKEFAGLSYSAPLHERLSPFTWAETYDVVG